MNRIEKVKKVTLIAVGFGLSTYLLINGFALLEQENLKSDDTNVTSEIHGDTVK